MVEKGLFLQNVIAVIWDFDKTLSPRYMQTPLFEHYGVDEGAFWKEVNALPAYYKRAGIHVQQDTAYLGHLLTYVQAGKMPGLTNAKFRELGAGITFYPGLPEIFGRLAQELEQPPFQAWDIHLEHYVVSTGIAEMIRGSAIAPYLTDIWASEFIEHPAEPGADMSGTPQAGPISQIAGFLDNTTKTRALFEINKGVNKVDRLSVNDMIPEDDRRVPFRNMIYVADGPSDVPSFSVVRKHGGQAFAVYQPESDKQFEQVDQLLANGRVNGVGPADYQSGSQTDMWLRLKVKSLAEKILKDRSDVLETRVGQGPEHIDDSARKEV